VIKKMDEIDIIYAAKDLRQILQKIPQLIEFQNIFEQLRYLFKFNKEEEIEPFIYETYESVFKIAGTSSRPFTGFT
jgi:tRNA nucleotidyltransferase/poly(A) polymerase